MQLRAHGRYPINDEKSGELKESESASESIDEKDNNKYNFIWQFT